MDEHAIDTADPIERAWSGGDHSVCPKCHHERAVDEGFDPVRALLKLMSRKPLRPRCPFVFPDGEGSDDLGTLDCGCKDTFHAS